MTKIEYSDRHRFIASIGVALIAISAALPFLYLKEPFDLLLEKDKINLLTPKAQEIITHRQELVSAFTRLLPFAVGVLLLVGLVFLIYGLYKWGKKQEIQDRTEALTLQQLELAAAQMSQPEVEEKLLDESKSIESQPATVPTRITNSLSSDSPTSKIKKAIEIEEKVLNKLKTADPKDYELLSQRRIGGREYDAILARKSNQGMDVLVEIKYFTGKQGKNLFYRLYDRLVSTTLAYERATGRKARGMTIVVVPTPELKASIREVWLQPMIELMRKKLDPSTYVITEVDVDEENLAEMIWGDPQFSDGWQVPKD